MNQVDASIISNVEIMPGTYLIWLESPRIASQSRPGQFVMVRCGKKYSLRRPLSVHQVDEKKEKIALLYSVVGQGTRWLSQCKSGDNIDLLGPLGNGFSIDPTAQTLLLVGGGIGIAPLRFLAQEALNQGHPVTLLSGAATATQLYPEHLLPPEAKLVAVTEDGTAGEKGMITDLLPDFTIRADQIFACGPVPMYRNMALKKRELGLEGKPVQVSLEMRMGCGRGICYGCTIKTTGGLEQVCKDGPVFDLSDIIWDELAHV